MHLPDSFAGRRWLEIALDYRCNLRCLGCHSCHDTGERLASSQAMELLRSGREQGIESLWLGGGEPTLRDDLLSLVRRARELGYRHVTVQTNGMRLSYAEYRTALVAAGVTDVRVNVKSHRADVHDRLSGVGGGPSCHALLLEALAGLETAGIPVTADVLLTRSTVDDLAQTVSFFGARGVGAFTLWLLSTADRAEKDVAREVPRIADLVASLGAAQLVARRLGVALRSLHTPPCTLPAELRALYTPASSLSLVVTGPEGRPFALESSPFEGGAYLEGCEACAERARCGGPRADYRRLHGDQELVPLPRHGPHA